jgi:hypothetical protein
MLIAGALSATSVPSLTFEELTDQSELVVSGQITRSWSEWDSSHKFIWTHHELSVEATQKGSPASTVVVSEPGGTVADRGMVIAGSVDYKVGEQVAVFLQRMPNGYLRTTGWAQGKYSVDQAGHLHAQARLRDLEIVSVNSAKPVDARGESIRSLDGITVAELRSRVAAHLASQRAGSPK